MVLDCRRESATRRTRRTVCRYKEALQGILVQVRDLFTDPWTAPFNAFDDRHVGRNNDVMPRVWNTGVDFNAAPVRPHCPRVLGQRTNNRPRGRAGPARCLGPGRLQHVPG
jgi:hypothetical protein